MKRRFLIIVGIWLTLLSFSVMAETIAVIVNQKNAVDKLSQAELNDIYRGLIQVWKSSGKVIQVINYPDDTALREVFYKIILDAPANEIFFLPGKPEPFRTSVRKSVRSVKRFVQRFENAIGYVPLSAVDDSVKVLYTIEDNNQGIQVTE